MKTTLVILALLMKGTLVHSSPFVEERDSLGADSLSTLTFTTTPSGAVLIIDSVTVGTTPLTAMKIHSGPHILRCLHPDKNSWLHPSRCESLIVGSGEHLERHIRFPLVYYVTSDPYGAFVRDNDSIIGRTPFILSTTSGKKTVTLVRDGYEDATIVLPAEEGEVHTRLHTRNNSFGGSQDLLMDGQPKSYTPVFVTSGISVASGVVAAYFKIKADGKYTTYRESGDPGLLSDVHRFDTISAVALISCEVSLIALSYFLLSK